MNGVGGGGRMSDSSPPPPHSYATAAVSIKISNLLVFVALNCLVLYLEKIILSKMRILYLSCHIK